MDFLLAHACKVNECAKEEFKNHIYESFKRWRDRSAETSWKLDLGTYEELFK